MKELVDEIISCNIDEIKDQNFPYNKKVGLIIYLDNVKYEFLINLKETDNMLILGSGARNSDDSLEDKQRPLFHRNSWDFMQSTIQYNDPTTYLTPELWGGWGLGHLDNWYLKNIAKIIEELLKKFNIDNENVIFYGSSLGGFMSIMLSILIKNSTSIAEIPQFDLTKWEYHWHRLKKYCFEGMSEEEIKNRYGYRIDIIELIKKENYIPKSFLILDCSHDYDFEKIFIPFFLRLNDLPFSSNKNNIRIRIDGKNKGHSVLNYEEVILLINNVEHITSNSFKKSLEENKEQNILKNIKENYKTQLNTQIKKLENEIFLLKYENLLSEEKNKDKTDEINRLNSIISDKNKEIKTLNNENNKKLKKINELEKFKRNVFNSNSWKYTEIFRNLRR